MFEAVASFDNPSGSESQSDTVGSAAVCIPLSELRLGDRAVVQSLTCKDAELRNKLLSMGLVYGARVRVVNIAPLGDPITFSLLGFHLSLRRSEAQAVTVTLSPAVSAN